MELISNICSFIYKLNTEAQVLLIIIILSAIFAVMCILSYINRDSLAEHFDKYMIHYFIISTLIVSIILLIMLYRVSIVLFGIVISAILVLLMIPIIPMGYDVPNYRNTYQRNNSFINRFFRKREERIKRRVSLKKAASFIKPYKDIMSKQTLSNQYCILTYIPDMHPKYTCLSKEKNENGEYSFFTASIDNNIKRNKDFRIASITNDTNWSNDFFNSICCNFSYKTNIDDLYLLFKTSNFVFTNSNYNENTNIQNGNNRTLNEKTIEKYKRKQEKQIKIEKFNVNNATEADLMALPGINIVQAKKIIKYRNFNGDFASIDDFISHIKVKPHFEILIRERISVQPATNNIDSKKSRTKERIIDLD